MGMDGWLAGGDDATQQIGHPWTLKCGHLYVVLNHQFLAHSGPKNDVFHVDSSFLMFVTDGYLVAEPSILVGDGMLSQSQCQLDAKGICDVTDRQLRIEQNVPEFAK